MRLMTLPPESGTDHRKTQQGQGKGKQQAIFEQIVGQMAHIEAHPQSATDDKDPPRQDGSQCDKPQIDQAIERLAQLAVGVHAA